MSNRCRLLIVLCIAVAALGSARSTGAQSLQKTRVTVPVVAVAFYPLFFAQEKGYFAKEGLDVEIISTNGDGPDVDAVISGSAQFAISTPNRLYTAFEQGKTLWAAATWVNRMTLDCIINKSVASRLGINDDDSPLDEKLKKMKGLTVAGTRPGSFSNLMLEAYARRVGLVPQRDLRIIGVGGPNSMIPAVENEQVAIACSGSPTMEMAVERGKSFKLTHNLEGEDPAYRDFLFQLVYVRPDFAKANPDYVRRFIRALYAAVAYVQDSPVAEHVPLMIAKLGLAGKMAADLLPIHMKTLKRDGVTTSSSVDRAAEFLLTTGAIAKGPKFDDVATNEFLPK